MQSFYTKDSHTLESFERKFEGFDTKDSEVELSHNGVAQNFDGKFESFESKDTKVDGRSKPRTRKQIDAYKRNFGAGKVFERKIMNSMNEFRIFVQLLLNIRSNQQ